MTPPRFRPALARLLGSTLAAGLLPSALAQAPADSARLAELEKKVDALTRELENRQVGELFQPVGESAHGLAPAASKVYQAGERSLSLGGYGEAVYYNYEGDKASEADAYRAILYTGFKYSEKLVMNSEIEFEHGTTGKEGEVSVEFLYLDYLHAPELSLRGGLLLVPMGLVNELHEPTTFPGVRRPDVESRILPTTWREMGAGVHGEIGRVRYEAYAINGFRAEKFTAKGLRDGRQQGSKAQAEDFAGVVRVDVEACEGLIVGVSGYHGDSGQTLDPGVRTTVVEAHAVYKRGGLTLRGLAAQAELDDVAELNRIVANRDAAAPKADAEIDSIGERMTGWYVEAAYDVMSLTARPSFALAPFVRVEQFDTQDKIPAGFKRSGANDVEVVTVGINLKPRDEVVIKADYQFYDSADGKAVDQFNLGLGYVF